MLPALLPSSSWLRSGIEKFLHALDHFKEVRPSPLGLPSRRIEFTIGLDPGFDLGEESVNLRAPDLNLVELTAISFARMTRSVDRHVLDSEEAAD